MLALDRTIQWDDAAEMPHNTVKKSGQTSKLQGFILWYMSGVTEVYGYAFALRFLEDRKWDAVLPPTIYLYCDGVLEFRLGKMRQSLGWDVEIKRDENLKI